MPGRVPERTAVIDPHVLRHLLAHPSRGTPWTIRSLARHVHTSPANLGHLCSGERTTLPGNLALSLSEAVGVPPQVLFMPWLSTESDTDRKDRQ